MSEPEQTAITDLLKGEVRGLEALVQIYQVRAVRAAYAILGNRHAAEDVVADAFVKVYEHIEQYDRRRPFAPWFYRIVVNDALKAARKASRSAPFDEELSEDLADSAPGPEDNALLSEMRYMVLSAIYSLPPQQRAALVLRYYLDMDEAAMAQTLGCPVGTVKWRLYSARQKLRHNLLPTLGPTLADNEA